PAVRGAFARAHGRRAAEFAVAEVLAVAREHRVDELRVGPGPAQGLRGGPRPLDVGRVAEARQELELGGDPREEPLEPPDAPRAEGVEGRHGHLQLSAARLAHARHDALDTLVVPEAKALREAEGAQGGGAHDTNPRASSCWVISSL